MGVCGMMNYWGRGQHPLANVSRAFIKTITGTVINPLSRNVRQCTLLFFLLIPINVKPPGGGGGRDIGGD